jgi:hypothetical protein
VAKLAIDTTSIIGQVAWTSRCALSRRRSIQGIKSAPTLPRDANADAEEKKGENPRHCLNRSGRDSLSNPFEARIADTGQHSRNQNTDDSGSNLQ